MMYAEELAWTLREFPEEAFRSISPDTLREFDSILKNNDPMLNSDLADLAVARCKRLVTEALKEFGC